MIIKNKQKWSDSTTIEYLYIINNKVIYSYCLSTCDKKSKDRFLYNVYVQEQHRGQGYFNDIMTMVNKECKGNIFVNVERNSTLVDKYKKLGFEYMYEVDSYYDCYVKLK